MPNQAQLIAQILQALLRRRGGKPLGRWVWLLAVGCIAYVLLGPWVAARMGWQLPGVTEGVVSAPNTAPAFPGPQRSEANSSTKSTAHTPAGELGELFTSVGRDEFVSPAGLHYSRGSQHGHRLRHLEAHTKDEPDRPGSHGVFSTTDMAAVVQLVDEAYKQALTGQRTRKEFEDGRNVYLVDLGRTIGYVGGENGGRQGHPAARKIRLVLEGEQVITAFPVR